MIPKLLLQNIKSEIDKNTANAAFMLFEIANKYVTDKELKHKAILLNIDYSGTKNQDDREKLRPQLLDLFNEIQIYTQKSSTIEDGTLSTKKIERLDRYIRTFEPKEKLVCQVRGLTKHFPKSNFALSNIDLDLYLGQITSVVGENGQGKSTLMEIISGNLRADDGEISYPAIQTGSELNWPQVKWEIAYVTQRPPRWYGTLKNNLRFEAARHGIYAEDNDIEVDFIITRFGLEDHQNKKWDELSGGFRSRFALARALIWKPKLLILDELLANLDVNAQAILLDDIVSFTKSLRYPISVLISSQDLHNIEMISDKTILLKDGKIAWEHDSNSMSQFEDSSIFEFSCTASRPQLREILESFINFDIRKRLDVYTLTIFKKIESIEVIKLLSNNNVELTYFRNITHSIKKKFLQI